MRLHKFTHSGEFILLGKFTVGWADAARRVYAVGQFDTFR